ncbi:hypothetical protein HELRODRAFT_169214 [Helobdella robusta]|uniref:FLYWCH-type domain-containing protein n=1 Tax=Helobdella robusta TaxID=6412 RepID=T1F1L1_HELRO|nr:hypothetical protein HELRODRAFT_169214 [Helobdella robusta]ESO08389.1 hypothetical protein HELRODRAFT_169214 [Helobdella robusta]
MSDLCIVCDRTVTAKQHALTCDVCTRWCHRKCGTGYTTYQYSKARQKNVQIPPRITFEIVKQATKRGGDHLVSSDGHNLTVKSKTKKGKTTWVCAKKTNGCKAIVIQQDNNFTIKNEHTCHAIAGATGLAKIRAKSYQAAMEQPFTSALDIVTKATREIVSAGEPFHLINPQHLARNANRFRELKRPRHPETLFFELDNSLIPQNFLCADLKRDNQRHLLFATEDQLNSLRQAENWFMDGTFSVVKKPFFQLYTIHVFIKHNDKYVQIPTLFCLMSGKATKDYECIFEWIVGTGNLNVKSVTCEEYSFVIFKNSLNILTIEWIVGTGNLNVKSVTCDFEQAVWIAATNILQVSIHGCLFHWTQAVFRKIKELGLQKDYNEKKEEHSKCKLLLALPFLPSEWIPRMFEQLDGPVKTGPGYAKADRLTDRPSENRPLVVRKPIRLDGPVETGQGCAKADRLTDRPSENRPWTSVDSRVVDTAVDMKGKSSLAEEFFEKSSGCRSFEVVDGRNNISTKINSRLDAFGKGSFEEQKTSPNKKSISVTVNPQQIMLCLRHFPKGTSGGRDSLTPQHLRDLTHDKIETTELISAMTGFINLLLEAGYIAGQYGWTGLGCRGRVGTISILSSAAATAALQEKILPMDVAYQDDLRLETFRNWCTVYGDIMDINVCSQKKWNEPSLNNSKSKLDELNDSPSDKARLMTVRSKLGSAWLRAISSTACGTRLDNGFIRVSLCLRLGLPVVSGYRCLCGADVSQLGYHGLLCRLGSGKQARHSAMNSHICRLFQKADTPAIKEPAGLLSESNFRPDGYTLVQWSQGCCLSWDVTFPHTLAKRRDLIEKLRGVIIYFKSKIHSTVSQSVSSQPEHNCFKTLSNECNVDNTPYLMCGLYHPLESLYKDSTVLNFIDKLCLHLVDIFWGLTYLNHNFDRIYGFNVDLKVVNTYNSHVKTKHLKSDRHSLSTH